MMAAILETQAAFWGRLGRFAVEITPGPEQPVEWHSPNEVVLRHPRFLLRRFEGPTGAPMLVVPPEINGSNLADYGPRQSLVESLQQGGFGPVHVLEWRTATEATRSDDIDASIDAIEACLAHVGAPAHLLGICQGGWEAAVVAARRPELVASLTLAAAPIDFRAGDGPLTRLVDATPPAAYASLVALGGGVMRGEYLRQGFTNLRFWERRVVDRVALWSRLDDEAWMERRHRMGRWYHARKDLPGPAYLRVVQELFRENRLIEGRFAIHGEPVDLRRIRCPLALVAGARDHITLPEQLFAAEEATSAARCRRWTVDAGHVGVVIRAGLPHWDEVSRWLLAA